MNDVVNALLLLQGLWGIFLVILTWAVNRVLKDIEQNTKATSQVAKSINDINLLLSGNYMTRREYDSLELRVREAEHRIVEMLVLLRKT